MNATKKLLGAGWPVAALAIILVPWTAGGTTSRSLDLPAADARTAYGRLPLFFEANRGQTDPAVQFLARGGGYGLFLSAAQSTLAIVTSQPRRQSELRMELLGADAGAKGVGLDELAGRSSYFVGNDPAAWRSDIPTYARVRFGAVYPGIDLIYHGSQGSLEYDFVVAPGAAPASIRLRFAGADHLQIAANGDLLLRVGGLDIRHHKPRIYQRIDGAERPVAGDYVLRAPGEVGFRLAAYDRRRSVVIDPVLSFASYLGGTGFEESFGAAVDGAGNFYICGVTASTNLPVAHALQPTYGGKGDAYVAKFAADGSRMLYSTYLGGSKFEQCWGMTLDPHGNLYVVGDTLSPDFPVTANALQRQNAGNRDGWLAKLDPTGSKLLYATFLGGSGEDFAYSIALDAGGAMYVVGETASADFPTVNPLQATSGGGVDAYVTKINPSGSAIVYSTYLGGSGMERAWGITVDHAGNAYVTGQTASFDFPTTPHAFQSAFGGGVDDAYVAAINASGSALIYSTYLGGNGQDVGFSIAGTGDGNVVVTGRTGSPDLPVTANAFQKLYAGGATDVLVAKFRPDGTPAYVTFLGGAGADGAFLVALDHLGNAYIAGQTESPDFPVLHAVQSKFGGGNRDGFLTKLSADGTKLGYSTFYGGRRLDELTGVAVDLKGNAYVVGFTESYNLPVVKPLRRYAGARDAFVGKIVDVAAPQVSCAVAQPMLRRLSNQLVDVGLTVSATDDSDPTPARQVLVYAQDGADPASVQVGGALMLRAERSASGHGRVYLIATTATDEAGNVGVDACSVVVPYDQGSAADVAAANREGAAAVALYKAQHQAPPGFVLIGQGRGESTD
jgi:hypothetical protein